MTDRESEAPVEPMLTPEDGDVPVPGKLPDEVSSPHPELLELLERCATLSRDYAHAGRARLAVLAMWMSDVHALQLLLMENGLHLAPDPAAELAGVGEALSGSLSSTSADDATPQEVLTRARTAIVATFDESVHVALTRRFLPMDHLNIFDGWATLSGDQTAEQRLGGRTSSQLISQLESTAQDCMAVAAELVAANDTQGALHQIFQADLASFEAFLIRVAVDCGDETLVTVTLSWDLAAHADAEQAFAQFDHAASLATVANSWRERLVVFGGWAQAGRMWAYFLPIPTA